MNISEKLIKLRKEKGLSQEQFGNEINVSRQAVSKWESGKSKPDMDKIKDIVKFYNITYEYLLDDQIEDFNYSEENNKDIEIKEENSKTRKHKKLKNILKILFVLVLIYLLISIYKFCVLTYFYKIADSFSEEKFSMIENRKIITESNEVIEMFIDTEKIDNDVLIKEYQDKDYENPSEIEYIDLNNKEIYRLSKFDQYYVQKVHDNTQMYFDTEEEFQNYFEYNKNILKNVTLDYLSTSLGDRIKKSINPLYFVSLKNRQIIDNDFKGNKAIYTLNNDYLLESYILKTELYGKIYISYSYDYVQDHFNNKEIKNPLDEYKDKIKDFEELN